MHFTYSINGLFSKLEEIDDSLVSNCDSQKKLNFNSFEYYLNSENSTKNYYEWILNTSNSKKRIIHTPSFNLKRIQNSVSKLLSENFEHLLHDNVFGFRSNKSIVQNAKMHVGRRLVCNIDIKDFFHSCDHNKFIDLLIGDSFKSKLIVATAIRNLTFYQNKSKRHFLPMGSPSSPVISNIVFNDIDWKLYKLCQSNGCFYSRYVDDITISTNSKITKKLFNSIRATIGDEGFILNSKKTRFQHYWQRQVVTGITVNQKLNVNPKLKKEIFITLKNWENKGIGELINQGSNVEKLLGKIEFCSQVLGKSDRFYLSCKTKVNELLSRDQNLL